MHMYAYANICFYLFLFFPTFIQKGHVLHIVQHPAFPLNDVSFLIMHK